MDKIKRRQTIPVKVGGVTIGGGAPVTVQSMTNTGSGDYGATLDQINRLCEAGADLVRVAVPDRGAADTLGRLAVKSPLPLIADIHFDVKLAFLALDNGASKIRINPGNIGGRDKLTELARKAREYKVPLRIGVNAGSLEKSLFKKHGGATAAALVESALGYLQTMEDIGFGDLVFSLKASDVYTTISAYRLFSKAKAYPLHLGVTGAGPPSTGSIKGAVGIGALLADGIGDTIRVSLTASPSEEIITGRRILQSLGLRAFAPDLISCPTCGRCEVELVPLVTEVEKMLETYDMPVKVAVMGCAVNGPGEAREADIGISAGKKRGILFRQGRVIRTVQQSLLLEALKEELDLLAARRGKLGRGRKGCGDSGNNTCL